MTTAPERPLMEPLWRELVGELLRERRKAQGRTLVQVAHTAGISPQYLSELERGLKEPSSEIVASACAALDLRLADLLLAVVQKLNGPQVIRLNSSITAPAGAPSATRPVLLSVA